MPLKYLFTATFADGSKLVQTLEDQSVLEPDKRSAFFDVLAKAKQTPLVRFELTEGEQTYAVDLTDGHFEHNGVVFAVSDGLDPNEAQNLAGATREIVFWRRHSHEIRMMDGVELGHNVRYDLGWQANVNGKNVQRLIHFT
jgi:hypothetical protein